MKDGKKLLSELGQLGGPQVYFRCHHLLTSGDGAYALKWGSTSAYKEDTNGTPIYDWTINDKIFDTYLERGIKPYVQIGFMPEALTTHPQNYPHNPPVNKRAPVPARASRIRPRITRSGANLPINGRNIAWRNMARPRWGNGIGKSGTNRTFFTGTGRAQEYFKLYDYAVAGVRRALPTARVGGPETPAGRAAIFCGIS